MEEKKKIVHNFDFIGRILEILRILQEETDEHTTISQTELLDLMNNHEYPCSDRTLSDYLRVLMSELNPREDEEDANNPFSLDDYRIITSGLERKYRDRSLGLPTRKDKDISIRDIRYRQILSFEELNQIIEAILFLKNIDAEKKVDLIRKLQKVTSANYPKYSPFISETTGKISTNISSVFEDSRVDEKIVRENLEIIRRAIEANDGVGIKIAFHFNGYNERKELVPRKSPDGGIRTYVANPYYVILYNGKYYLICSVEPYDTVSFYRIDLMSELIDKTKVSVIDHKTLVSERRRPKREIKGLPVQWDDNEASKFQAEHMNMFYGEPCEITLKIDRERYTLLHDYFGDRYTFQRNLDEKWDVVCVKCVPDAMVSFAMQCSDVIEVIEPEEVREKVISKCKRLLERYQ